jgi:sialate O-acetylesterase
MKKILFIIASLLLASAIEAKVVLPQLFQSGMVMQRGKSIPVWGWADKGEQVSIQFNKKQYSTIADEQGRWRIDLPKMKAGGPYIIEVRGEGQEVREIADVLIGDVWLCSGQSNIDVHIERVYPQYVQEIDSYENPQIRLFRVQNDTDTHGPKSDIMPTAINWKPLTKQNAWPFSAVGYFLGKRMYEKTKVPQGIIVNSWGGTPIEAWISADSLRQDYPMLLKRTEMMQSDKYVEAQRQANAFASQQWQQILDGSDPGLPPSSSPQNGGRIGGWTAANYDDSQWQTIDQDGWQWRGCGTVWLRQHIQIDQAHAGKPARLLLGTLFDSDVTYVNGKQVGTTGYQYPPRRYDLPEGLLREGDNVITIRFINKYGTAHFIPEKPYLIAFGDDRQSLNPLPKDVIPLSTTWLHHAGAELPSCPSSDVSLQNLPTTLYNAVVHPLAPFAISGVVWYQGESNTGHPQPYADLLRKMMGNWRTLWQQPKLPFCIVQLANHDGRQQTGNPSPLTPQLQPVNSGWAQLREAQRTVAVSDPHAELAVAIDLGEPVDIHPLRKKEVAERVGLCMDRLVFGKKVELSPQPLKAEVMGQQVVITFDQTLLAGEQPEFEVAGVDRKFRNAPATSRNREVTIESPIAAPVYVRYAWKDNPNAKLLSAKQLPASPFEMSIEQ